jgi:hypothetical protein
VTEQMAVATSRIATLTSVIRTRRQDAVRREVHAGLPRDLNARAENAIVRLERVAEKLEKALA